MALTETGRDWTGAAAEGIDEDRRRRLVLVGVWMLVGVEAVFTALEVGTWFLLRSLDVDHMWRAVGCTTAHPCPNASGLELTGPVPPAGHTHLAGVVVLAVLAAGLAAAAERSVRRGAGSRATARWALAASLVAVLAAGYQVERLSGLPFSRFDGAYATTYSFFAASNAAQLVLVAVLLFGFGVRARQGRFAGGDLLTPRVVRIVVVTVAAAVTVLALVASVAV